MDRSKWEYKKLGEVAKISSGKAIPSSEISEIYIEGFYPCYGGNGLRGYVNQYSNDGFIPVIGRVGALCGNVHLPQEKFYATEHALVVNLKANDKPHFIEYLLSALNLRQYAKGVAQPVLSASTLSEILIPIPPLSDQQRIVAELDCLNEMIAVKQEQLKEFDKLAQSIFYDMFGDPNNNEKSWQTEMWNDVFVTKTGKLNANAMDDNGLYPFFTCSKESYRINHFAFDCEALLLSGNNATANYDVKYYKGKFNAYQRTYVLTIKNGNSYVYILKSASNLNGNLNCSKELEHYAS